MKLIINREIKNITQVTGHPEYGKAVFIECGVFDPHNYCYDHHFPETKEGDYLLSPGEMILQEMLQGRKMPSTVICNHVRHLDNLVAMYLLEYPFMVTHPQTTLLVATAGIIDRVGPMAARSTDQLLSSVLRSAQLIIPDPEWDCDVNLLQGKTYEALAILRNMVAMPVPRVQYTTLWEAADRKGIIVETNERLGVTLYEQGYEWYIARMPLENGNWKYAIAKASPYVFIDLGMLATKLNEVETEDRSETTELWGGKGTFLGSPMPSGSRLPWETLLDCIEMMKKQKFQ